MRLVSRKAAKWLYSISCMDNNREWCLRAEEEGQIIDT
jgi:hypothetical protein